MKTNKLLKALGTAGMALTLIAPVAAPVIVDGANTVLAAKTRTTGNYSITLHKTQGDPTKGTTANGYEGPTTTVKGLGGVTFKITEIQPTGKVQDMKANDPSTWTAVTGGTQESGVTSSTAGSIGDLTFANLGQGYYIVQETKPNGVDTKTPDFIVSLPMTYAADFTDSKGVKHTAGSIIQNVELWPKNMIDSSTNPENPDGSNTNMALMKNLIDKDGKAVKSENLSVGDTATWQLNGHVPETTLNTVDGKDVYGTFSLSDPVSTNLSVDTSKITGEYGTSKDGVYTKVGDLTVGTDYTIVKSSTTVKNAAGNEFNVYTIALTNAGIAKTHGQRVVFSMPSTVVSVPTKTDKTPVAITNTLTGNSTSAMAGVDSLYQDTIAGDDKQENVTSDNGTSSDPTDDVKVAVPTDPSDTTDAKTPQVDVGRIDFLKVDAVDGKTPLSDAQFTVYTDEACTKPLKYVSGMTGTFANTGIKDGDDVVLKSGADGKLDFTGFANQGTLYVKETLAPKGYLLSDKVTTLTSAMDITNDATIQNAKDEFSGNLPVTGSQLRIILMTLGSLIMVACGVILYMRKRKELDNK